VSPAYGPVLVQAWEHPGTKSNGGPLYLFSDIPQIAGDASGTDSGRHRLPGYGFAYVAPFHSPGSGAERWEHRDRVLLVYLINV